MRSTATAAWLVPDEHAATDASLATAVAASLYRSGIPAAATYAGDEAWLTVALEPDLTVEAWLEMVALSHAVVEDAAGRQTVMRGPLAPGTERCDDPACVSAAILEWVIAWRAGIR